MKRELLIAKREELGLSQAEVAKRVGVSRSFYCLVEQGKRGIRLDLAHNISKELKIKFSYDNFK